MHVFLFASRASRWRNPPVPVHGRPRATSAVKKPGSIHTGLCKANRLLSRHGWFWSPVQPGPTQRANTSDLPRLELSTADVLVERAAAEVLEALSLEDAL